ncbi:MAG TPA: DUF192 domain-containing protein [Elusimicrobiota bacterium]|jgi:uncharacterized membrane protein (UPF0127 family)|nr:DUF192 domain-containing protein [Elusimicrobiota bacterium]
MRRLLPLGLLLAAACKGPAPDSPAAPQAAAPSVVVGARLRRLPLGFPNGSRISVEVAEDERSRELGLMFRTVLEPDYGMLFVFPDEQELQFWMKNTFVDLDMLFIGADRRITVVHANVPRSRPDTSDQAVARRGGRGRYVLELAAGEAKRRGLRAGDLLDFAP